MYLPIERGFDRHPKTIALRRILKNPLAHGYLTSLWEWAMDFAPDGDLSRFSDTDIAAAAHYRGKPETFVAALITVKYLKKDRTLNDWNARGRGGWMNTRRGKDAARQRRRRKRARSGLHAVTPFPDDHEDGGTPTE